MKHFFRSICTVLLALSLIACLFSSAFAVSSSDIQDELDALEKRADEIDAQKNELQAQIDANDEKTVNVVDQRAQVDHEVTLIYQQVQNLNEQLRQYNLLIAEKQAELDDLQAQQNDLLEHYKQRLRAMQEQGDISYWAVIFRANSFSEMLNRISMVEEIAKSDQRMMEEIRTLASDVLSAKETLAAEKVAVEEKKTELAAAEEELEAKRAESEKLLDELIANAELLDADMEKYDAMKNELAEEIAQKEKEYNDKVEAERRAQEEANKNNNGGGSTGGSTGGGSTGDGSFLYPLPRSCGSWCTSPYGYRYHPISGTYTFHSGVDLAASGGTPIYASKSGTVTTAAYAQYSWGNYVVINHGDGYSTLYAHMRYYAVSVGEHVNQGDVIGYVGTTGNSNGNHLHFNVYYNGSLQNPFDYVSVP